MATTDGKEKKEPKTNIHMSKQKQHTNTQLNSNLLPEVTTVPFHNFLIILRVSSRVRQVAT